MLGSDARFIREMDYQGFYILHLQHGVAYISESDGWHITEVICDDLTQTDSAILKVMNLEHSPELTTQIQGTLMFPGSLIRTDVNNQEQLISCLHAKKPFEL